MGFDEPRAREPNYWYMAKSSRLLLLFVYVVSSLFASWSRCHHWDSYAEVTDFVIRCDHL
jgi:hypothetical protein